MEENKIEETKKTKKKGMPRLLYWLIVIVGISFIISMSFSIGQKLAQSEGNGNENDVTENESNVNEESNSNVAEENNSNITEQNSNNNQTTTATPSYTVKDLLGTYKSAQTDVVISFSSKATYSKDVAGPACGAGVFGNFVVEGNKVYLYPLIGSGCDDAGWRQIEENYEEVTIVSATEIKIGNDTLKKTADPALNDSKDDSGLRYAIKTISGK